MTRDEVGAKACPFLPRRFGPRLEYNRFPDAPVIFTNRFECRARRRS